MRLTKKHERHPGQVKERKTRHDDRRLELVPEMVRRAMWKKPQQ
jgi:hypothetical protein